MKFILGLIAAAVLATTAHAELHAVPNPAVQGDEVWVLRKGTIVGKFRDVDFLGGTSATVGEVNISSTFCRPAPKPEPPAYEPPPFIAEDDTEEVETPNVDSSVSLLDVIITVGGAFLGYYLGRRAAQDDEEVDAAEAPSEDETN